MTITAIDLPMEAIAQFCDRTNYRQWAIATAQQTVATKFWGGVANYR